MHDLRLGGEVGHLAGDAVVEPRAERDDEVALLQTEHRGHGAVHAGHAEVLRVRVGKRAARHQSGHDGRTGLLGELQQLLLGSAADHSAADVQDRLLRGGEHLTGGDDLLAVRLRHRAVAEQLDLGRPDERGRLLLRVLGDVDEHRAGTAGGGDLDGGGEHAGHVFGLGHQE